MHQPETQKLPLSSKEIEFQISDQILEAFWKAFNWKSKSLPPTLAARAFTGMFDLLNKLEVNWKGLLHTSQSFDYHEPIQRNQLVVAQCQLVKWRKRSSTHWLQFESKLRDKGSSRLLLEAHSLILVGDQE